MPCWSRASDWPAVNVTAREARFDRLPGGDRPATCRQVPVPQSPRRHRWSSDCDPQWWQPTDALTPWRSAGTPRQVRALVLRQAKASSRWASTRGRSTRRILTSGVAECDPAPPPGALRLWDPRPPRPAAAPRPRAAQRSARRAPVRTRQQCCPRSLPRVPAARPAQLAELGPKGGLGDAEQGAAEPKERQAERHLDCSGTAASRHGRGCSRVDGNAARRKRDGRRSADPRTDWRADEGERGVALRRTGANAR